MVKFRIAEECPDDSMEINIPEDLEEFFEVMVPRNFEPEDVIPGGRGIRLTPGRPNIMIYKEGRLPFDVLFLVFDASQPVRVIFERANGPDVERDVSES